MENSIIHKIGDQTTHSKCGKLLNFPVAIAELYSINWEYVTCDTCNLLRLTDNESTCKNVTTRSYS